MVFRVGDKVLISTDENGDHVLIGLVTPRVDSKVAILPATFGDIPVKLLKPKVDRRYAFPNEWTGNRVPIPMGGAGYHVLLPNSTSHSMSVFDITELREYGRYKVYPSGNSSPSRMCMSEEGVFFCANRSIDTIIEINYNSPRTDIAYATSSGTNELTYGTDVMTTWEYVCNPTSPYTGSVRRPALGLSYTGSLGMRGIVVDSSGILWAASYTTQRWWRFNTITHTFVDTFVAPYSYGSIINKYGTIWSSNMPQNYLTRMNPDKTYQNLATGFALINGQGIYGVGIDENGCALAGSYYNAGISKFDLDGTKLWTKTGISGMSQTRGVIGFDDHIYACGGSDSNPGQFSKFDTDGNKLGYVNLAYPYGVSVDVNGKLWVGSGGNTNLYKLDPGTGNNPVLEATYSVGSTLHYSYSDYTGYSTLLYR